MFTRIFKSDYIIQFIFILIVSLILFGNSLLNSNNTTNYNDTPIMYFLNYITGNHKYIIITFNFILLVFEALLFKRVLSSNDLFPKNNLSVSFIYIITIASLLNFSTLQPILFVNFFLIIILQIILSLYNKTEDYVNIFNLGALVSLSSLFYFPSVIFFIFLILSFFIYNLFKWREWIIISLGFLTTYIIYFGISFLLDIFNNELLRYKYYFHSIQFHPINFEKNTIFFIGVFAIFFTYTMFSSLNKLTEKSIFYRKKIIVILMLFICSMASFLFNTTLINYHLCLVFLSAVFFITAYISQIKKAYISEIIYIILIGVSIYHFF